jgi:hypothetical protein
MLFVSREAGTAVTTVAAFSSVQATATLPASASAQPPARNASTAALTPVVPGTTIEAAAVRDLVAARSSLTREWH